MNAPPVAPPIMGYTGANPVRAMQAMNGGTNRISAAPYGPMPTRPMLTGAPPPRPSAAEFNPLSNAGQFAKPMVTFDPGGFGQRPATPLPPLTQAGSNAPPINPSAPPLTNPPGGTTPLANVPSPTTNLTSDFARALSAAGANRPTINPTAPPLTVPPGSSGAPLISAPRTGASNLAPTGIASAATPLQRAVQQSGGNRPTTTGTQPAQTATTGTIANANRGPTSPLTTAAIPTLSATTGDNRTAPTFTAYNAADPNRALKMMRGY